MHIGTVKELKNHEARVGFCPLSVTALIKAGHEVWIEKEAGLKAGFSDALYSSLGANIVETNAEVFEHASLIVKVKELLLEECKLLNKKHILFTYLHLAAHLALAEKLLSSGASAVAYETVTDSQGRLPLLAPMSAIAGRLAVIAGAYLLQTPFGGRGILLSGMPGINPGKVVVIGGGVAGTEAAILASGMGAEVIILDKSRSRLKELDTLFNHRVTPQYSEPKTLEKAILEADLAIGAVLVPGATTPKIVPRDWVRRMQKGSVIVDVAIDQGGCFETSRPTSYSHPTYVEEGVLHYCVDNMNAGVPHTATLALNQATLPFILELANKGLEKACRDNPHLRDGLNIWQGHITHPTVAKALNKPYTKFEDVN